MSPIEAVHTFARHCCIDHLVELRQARDRAKTAGTDKEVTYGCRRAVVEAILVEVERLALADFRSRKHATLRLIETGQLAQNHPTMQKMWQTAPYLLAMQEERDWFVAALRQFTAQEDWKHWRGEPLPYRRTLQAEQSARLLANLRERWRITGKWWIPFEKYELPYAVVMLDSQAVREQLGYAILQAILARRGIQRVYELWEMGNEPNRELEVALWEPTSTFSERYWCTAELDWLIYTTHENSTTIAGDWLLQEIKAVWPDWEAHLWVAPWKAKSLTT